jgi:flavorubredoxin
LKTQIDHIVGGIYRIATAVPDRPVTYNQFLVDDEAPTLIHTGQYELYDATRAAIAEVLDPKRLENIVLLHWEGDENGGMDRFMAEAPKATLVGSALSIRLNASGFGLGERSRGFQDGDFLELGTHTMRFLETPHVHHWDSMMVVEEATNSLFPSDLFLQPGDQPPVVTENLAPDMIASYRNLGIFAHEKPVRDVVDRIEALDPKWVHAMHGGTLTAEVLPTYMTALREQDFGYRGMLMGRELNRKVALPSRAAS